MLDPSSERFNHYVLPHQSNDVKKRKGYIKDVNDCRKQLGKSKKDPLNLILQKELHPLELQRLTKPQYRYLRDSIQMMHKNDVFHGDLPGNVMMDPTTGMPIIDWGSARLDANRIEKEMDYRAFLDHFKVQK
jgi:thiamine kinase-like enzyme